MPFSGKAKNAPENGTLEFFDSSKYNISKTIQGGASMESLTVKKAGERWGITARTVNYYCSAGQIKEAIKRVTYGLFQLTQKSPKMAAERRSMNESCIIA